MPDLDDRERPSPELIARLNELIRNCLLAGLSLEEVIAVLNVEAAKHGFEYRAREQQH